MANGKRGVGFYIRNKTWNKKHEIKKFNPKDPTDSSEFVYFGILNWLKNIVGPNLHQTLQLKLQFHINRLSIYKSSNKHWWPILGKIQDDVKYKCFTIAGWSDFGKTKPALLFLKILLINWIQF